MPLLKVDSTYRVSGTPEEYDIDLFGNVKNVLRMRLVAANVPKSIYPVLAGYNNTFQFDDGGGYATVDITNLTDYQSITDPVLLAAALTTEVSAIEAGNTFTYDPARNQISWTSAAGGLIRGTTSEGFNRMSGLTDAVLTNAGSGATVWFPNMVDMSWPRWLRLAVTVAGDRGANVSDQAQTSSFAFQFNTADFLEIESIQENETFRQLEMVANQSFQRVHVKWSLPDPSLALSFNGVDHQLVFETY